MLHKQYNLFQKVEENILVVAVLVPPLKIHLLTPYQAVIMTHWINLHCFDPSFSIDFWWTQGFKLEIFWHENSDWLKLIRLEYRCKSRKQYYCFFRPIAPRLSVANLFVFQLCMHNSRKFRSARKIPSSGEQPWGLGSRFFTRNKIDLLREKKAVLRFTSW